MKHGVFLIATLSILSAEQMMVKDEVTKLLWEDTSHVESTKTTHTQAANYCQKLELNGVKGWRIPTLHELLSIVNYNRYKPALLKEFNYYNEDTLYWSSTPYVKRSDEYWGVTFKDGATSNASINYDRYIRCVKSI